MIKLHKRIDKSEKEDGKLYIHKDSSEVIDICLNCPLPECVQVNNGCKRLRAEIKKLKRKDRV